jgi:hypothetical protein
VQFRLRFLCLPGGAHGRCHTSAGQPARRNEAALRDSIHICRVPSRTLPVLPRLAGVVISGTCFSRPVLFMICQSSPSKRKLFIGGKSKEL